MVEGSSDYGSVRFGQVRLSYVMLGKVERSHLEGLSTGG